MLRLHDQISDFNVQINYALTIWTSRDMNYSTATLSPSSTQWIKVKRDIDQVHISWYFGFKCFVNPIIQLQLNKQILFYHNVRSRSFLSRCSMCISSHISVIVASNNVIFCFVYQHSLGGSSCSVSPSA